MDEKRVGAASRVGPGAAGSGVATPEPRHPERPARRSRPVSTARPSCWQLVSLTTTGVRPNGLWRRCCREWPRAGSGSETPGARPDRPWLPPPQPASTLGVARRAGGGWRSRTHTRRLPFSTACSCCTALRGCTGSCVCGRACTTKWAFGCGAGPGLPARAPPGTGSCPCLPGLGDLGDLCRRRHGSRREVGLIHKSPEFRGTRRATQPTFFRPRRRRIRRARRCRRRTRDLKPCT